MKNTYRLILIVLVAIIGISGVISAQEADETPLIMLMYDELWSWSGNTEHFPVQFTACQPPDERIMSIPVISPDGHNMVFMTEPLMVREAIERSGGIGGGPLPNNIWLCGVDTSGRALTLVAPQPPDASFASQESVIDKAHINSIPAWSPDGSKVAWTTYFYPDIGEQKLTIYNLASATAISIPINMSPQYGIPMPLPVTWGKFGIALHSIAYNPDAMAADESFIVYGENGNYITETPINIPAGDFIYHTILIEDNSSDYVGLLYRISGWVLFSPLTGQSHMLANEIAAAPENYSILNPNGSSLILTLGTNFEFKWWVNSPDAVYVNRQGQAVAINQDNMNRITPGPTGAIAIAYDQVSVWQNEETYSINMTESFAIDFAGGIAWGPTAWRVHRETRVQAAAQVAERITCPGFIESRLVIGEQGRVSPGDPNNFRANPGTAGAAIGQIPGAGVFTVLDGPVCVDNFAWWQVNYNGMIGWTAEGMGQEYWLEPWS
jgi:hypothetical protein